MSGEESLVGSGIPQNNHKENEIKTAKKTILFLLYSLAKWPLIFAMKVFILGSVVIITVWI